MLHKPAVQASGADLAVGRASLPLADAAAGRRALAAAGGGASRFAPTGHVLRNMERVAAATCLGEPVLLVGETGTGKTTLVQQIAKQVWGGRQAVGASACKWWCCCAACVSGWLCTVAYRAAHGASVGLPAAATAALSSLLTCRCCVCCACCQVGAKLVVLNLSQQTDSGDLLGGFRPVQPAEAVLPLLERFGDLVRRTWWRGNNDEFLGRVARLAEKRKWGQLVKAFRAALDKVAAAEQQQQEQRQAAAAPGVAPPSGGDSSSKKQKHSGSKKAAPAAISGEVLREWRQFGGDVAAAEAAATAAEGGFAFAFVEGALVKAVREGWWLLLDEMNLAPAEVRERRAEGRQAPRLQHWRAAANESRACRVPLYL